ncbi:MAG: NrfD/PsrC family molybdoenzyme membrane anchor subunit [Candidatus Omnitrophota bacterium]
MSEYKIVAQMSFDWMIAAYFFLGGLSAGTYIFSVAANYWRKEFKPLALTATVLTPVTIAIGMLILLADLGRPDRALGLVAHFNPTSAVSWGFWIINIFLALSVLYGWFVFKGEAEKGKNIAYIGLPLSIAVAAYTGVLLAQAPGKELWHATILPVLFLVGGITSGLALILLVSGKKIDEVSLRNLGKLVAWLVILELGLIFIKIIVYVNGEVSAQVAAQFRYSRQFGFLFWVVELALGGLIPIAILLRSKTSPLSRTVATVLILIGIFVMRYIIVVGGQIAV